MTIYRGRRHRRSLGGGPLAYVGYYTGGVQSGKTYNVGPPVAGVQVGDLLVMMLYCKSSTAAYTTPAGWTLYQSVSVNSPASMRLEIWTRYLQPGETSTTITHATTTEHIAFIAIFRNAVPDLVGHGKFIAFNQSTIISSPEFLSAPDGIVIYLGADSFNSIGTNNGFGVGYLGRTYSYWLTNAEYPQYDISGGSIPARSIRQSNGYAMNAICIPVIVKQG